MPRNRLAAGRTGILAPVEVDGRLRAAARVLVQVLEEALLDEAVGALSFATRDRE